MYIKTFKLKQHTPIIHFQSGEKGATLRASEVKPKLDKFLIKKLGKDNIKKEWKRRYENGEIALDYGMSFVAINYRKIKIENRHRNSPMYFGNMGDGEDKHLVFADGVEGKIKCKNEDLLEKLESKLPEFFFLHNFGTRQSKGYGSFTVESIGEEKDLLIKPSSFFSYQYSKRLNNNENDFEKGIETLKEIDLFYKSLRSGINLKNRSRKTTYYFKSALFMYVNYILKEQWDKKTIKAEYFASDLKEQNKKHNSPDILNNAKKQDKDLNLKNYKDLLGLSSVEEWKTPYRKTIKKEDINEVITRFKSPILFKPIRNSNGTMSVFFDVFLLDDILSYYGTKFKVTAQNKKNLILPIPDKFDYRSFMNYTFKNIDPKKHSELPNVDGGRPDRWAEKTSKSLIRIYAELKKQIHN